MFDVPKNPTVAPSDRGIILKTQAPSLLGKSSTLKGAAAAAALSEACWRPVTLTNPLEATLVFSVSTEGPFVIKASGALGGLELPPPPGATATASAAHAHAAPTQAQAQALVGGVKSIASIAQQRGSVASAPSVAAGPSLASASAAGPAGSTSVSAGPSGFTSVLSSATGKTPGGGAGGSSSVGRIFSLLPQQSAYFSVAFMPKKTFRKTLSTTVVGAEAGDKPTEADGKLVITFSTGQSLHVPISAKVATPFITASSPNLWFGTCHVTATTEGTLMLSNPTDVPARWTVAHVPSSETTKRVSAIQVAGYNERGPETDDPSVFDITPGTGVVRGPTLSVVSAVGAPPKDLNRLSTTTVVRQRLSETSWADPFARGKGTTGQAGVAAGGALTLTMKDTLKQRFEAAAGSDAKSDALYPMPVQVLFKPRKNLRYNSRFRFTCEYGNAFDVILQGEGTYEEHEHKPLAPFPR
jgi:hypothetical protein